MLSLLGSLLGLGTSFLPNLLDFFQDKQDKAHELKMIAAQADAQAKLEGVRLQAVSVEADIRQSEALLENQTQTIMKGSKWLANLSGSLRPVVTYIFVLEFVVINAAIAYLIMDQQGITIDTLKQILDDRFMGLLSSMLGFWFGNRTFGKRKV